LRVIVRLSLTLSPRPKLGVVRYISSNGEAGRVIRLLFLRLRILERPPARS
jgi:hypothetical protein